MILNIRVKTNSGKQEINKISEGKYLVNLKSFPENNKANLELIKLLKKEFKKNIKIIKGIKSRKKIIEVN